MAGTAAIVDRNLSIGKYKATLATVTLDSSYASGGESVTGFPNSVGLKRVVGAIICGAEDGYVGQWDLTNSKLIAYYGDNNNASDGVLIEPTGVDLSTAAFLVLFFGTA